MNPISRLAQSQQAKNKEEPEYLLLTEVASYAAGRL